MLGHYWGNGEAKVTVNAKVSGDERGYKTSFDFPAQSTLYPEVERLWAYAKIEELQNQMDYFGEDNDTLQAITDLAVDAGLVTQQTSMIVVREEEFVNRGIDRKNSKRVQKEHQAQQQRRKQEVKEHRVDRKRPMFSNPIPNVGGGAMGPWMILLLLPLLMRCLKRKS